MLLGAILPMLFFTNYLDDIIQPFFHPKKYHILGIQFSSVAQSHRTLCDPMNHSMQGLPIHQQLLESTQTHFH